MKQKRFKSLVALVATLSLSACGGAESEQVKPNTPPVVTVNPIEPIEEGKTVTLTANATDEDGTIATFRWAQTSGQTLNLANTSQSSLSFEAPQVVGRGEFILSVTVTDDKGAAASTSITVIVVDEEVKTASRALQKAVENGIRPVLDVTDTLAGVDANSDGIRDDIAAYIASLPITDVQKKRSMEFAASLQKTMLLNLQTTTDLDGFAREKAQIQICFLDAFDTIQTASEFTRKLYAYTGNTKDRAYALHAYDAKRNGTVLRLPSKANCPKN